MLFEGFERTDTSPKRNGENSYEFLNRSARSEIGRVRAFVEQLYDDYPACEKDEIAARIRCGNDVQLNSAVFELLLYSALVKLGCAAEPHPALPGVDSRPDFLVTTPEGDEFYLEAVLASRQDDIEPASMARIGTTIDALTSVAHTNFLVGVESEGLPTTQPSGKKLRSAVLSWLDTLDPDQLIQLVDEEGVDSLPIFKWSHESWEVIVRPFPLKPERRGKSKSLIGFLEGPVGIVDEWTPIRNAIKFKGGKYGALEKPFVVAVNFSSFNLDRIDEIQALYGQEELVCVIGDPDAEPRFQRASNGAWRGKNGPQYTRVSGAWIFNDLTAYTVAERHSTVYFNPWAKNPLPEFLKRMPHAMVVDDKMRWFEGLRFGAILGKEEGWLE